MFKKELAVQQRKTAEAVALQQQQPRKSETPKTVVVQTVAADTSKKALVVAVTSTTTTPNAANGIAATAAAATPTNGRSRSPPNKSGAGMVVPTTTLQPVVEKLTPSGSSKLNTKVDVAAEMERMDRILAEHSASQTPPPPLADDTNTSISISPQKTNDGIPANVNTNDDAMATVEKIISIKPIKTAHASVSLSSYTPPASPAKISASEENTGLVNDDVESNPDVEVYKKKQKKKTPSLTVVTSISAGRQALRTTTPPPLLDPEAAAVSPFPETAQGEMSSGSPAQSCGTGTASYAAAKQKENYNEEYPGDISIVRQPAGRRPGKLDGLEGLGDFKEDGDDDSSVNSGTSSGVGAFDRKQAAEDKSSMSSIDAFEASFKTSFPESFSPRDLIEEKKTSEATSEAGIYNPFFPSPAKKSPGGESAPTSTDRPWANNARDRQSVAARRMEVRRNSGASSSAPVNGQQSPSPKIGTPTASPAPPSKSPVTVDPSLKAPFSASLSPIAKKRAVVATPITSPLPHTSPAAQRYSPSTPQQGPSPRNSTGVFRTPPPLAGSTTPSPEKSSEQPSRPEKTGYDAARARYEKALKPRGAPGHHDFKERDAPTDELLKLSSTEPTVVGPDVTGSESPSVRDRAAVFSESSPRTQEKPAVRRDSWGAKVAAEKKQSSSYPLSDEDDGDIPMHSTLSAKKPALPSVPMSSAVSGSYVGNGNETPSSGSKSEIQEARTRLRPWDSAPISSGQVNEERDQSEIVAAGPPSPSRFTLSGQLQRSGKDQQPLEDFQHISPRYRRGEVFRTKPDAAGIGPQ
jgi:hypothetical protein